MGKSCLAKRVKVAWLFQKLRHCVYISKEAHGIVSKIVNTIADKEITVGGYIDTVLMRHFEENKDEINDLYRRNRDNLI